MNELRKIPNVGKATQKSLEQMGFFTIESLKGVKAEELYERECAIKGCRIDRCQLYLYRAVEYWINTPEPAPELCRWWNWKDVEENDR